MFLSHSEIRANLHLLSKRRPQKAKCHSDELKQQSLPYCNPIYLLFTIAIDFAFIYSVQIYIKQLIWPNNKQLFFKKIKKNITLES